MTKEFNNLEELKPYYNEETNTYIFRENGECLDVKFNFNLIVDANIDACDIDAGDITACNIDAGSITAHNITAHNIDAHDIDACNITAYDIIANDITARDISFYAFCISYKNINCNSIKGQRENHIMKALDGEIIKKKGK